MACPQCMFEKPTSAVGFHCQNRWYNPLAVCIGPSGSFIHDCDGWKWYAVRYGSSAILKNLRHDQHPLPPPCTSSVWLRRRTLTGPDAFARPENVNPTHSAVEPQRATASDTVSCTGCGVRSPPAFRHTGSVCHRQPWTAPSPQPSMGHATRPLVILSAGEFGCHE
jgi:hypothetical protein